jgi:hypothetical protein
MVLMALQLCSQSREVNSLFKQNKIIEDQVFKDWYVSSSIEHATPGNMMGGEGGHNRHIRREGTPVGLEPSSLPKP